MGFKRRAKPVARPSVEDLLTQGEAEAQSRRESPPFQPAKFYYVRGECGSMTLYYKAGTSKAMSAVLTPAEAASAEMDPRLLLQMKVSDKFAEQAGTLDPRTPDQIFADSMLKRSGF